MKISESLQHELLELTRMYTFCPYNSIFLFVAYEQYHNLEFFNENIADVLTYQKGYPKYVLDLVGEIQQELEWLNNAVSEA